VPPRQGFCSWLRNWFSEKENPGSFANERLPATLFNESHARNGWVLFAQLGTSDKVLVTGHCTFLSRTFLYERGGERRERTSAAALLRRREFPLALRI
jgi:hypothetical protein